MKLNMNIYKKVVNIVKVMNFFEIYNCNGRSIDYYIKLAEGIDKIII